ncbi:MAG: hypothetical protein AB7E51_05830 [Pseudodesulfovibrio sp.]|jgi:sulfur carrier protein|uniref:Sulfur carrier protein n=1 Tax=Pseudodesulfovibrio indicus TaxID=1716143 RepID=A0A126QNV8_9BACT|nr:hypothetical protein [Pseudodesulfovibrio indicus]AMK11115.1 hypothetical protein AWY79_08305 [Pseudodesulfovibrio indicus]TDT92131.1 sulfur carrier protein [Pseudodesulfovibrio indicus]
MITVNLEPDGKRIELADTRTVLAVLNRLQLRPTMVIVARGDELLTPDRKLANNDELLVRKVTSAG